MRMIRIQFQVLNFAKLWFNPKKLNKKQNKQNKTNFARLINHGLVQLEASMRELTLISREREGGGEMTFLQHLSGNHLGYVW